MSVIDILKGKLEIHVISARDLRDRELLFKMDPYVNIKCGEEKFKSKVVKNGGSTPVWNQYVEFNLKEVDGKTPLRFEVYDYKHLAEDRQVGRADIALELLIHHAGGKEEGHWFKLVHFEDPEKAAGEIQVGIRYEGDGVPREKDIKRKEELEKEKLLQEEENVVEAKRKAEEEEKKAQEEEKKAQELALEKQALEEQNRKLQADLAEAASRLVVTEVVVVETKEGGHGKHLLHRHQKLKLGERLVSENGTFNATLQAEDGNFVLSKLNYTIWTAATNDTGARELILQKDNNVVIYDDQQRPQWSSETGGSGQGAARLVLQNDGNLALKDERDEILWATNTGGS